MYARRISSWSAGFRVRFNLSSWSGSSTMVGFWEICFIASRANVFAWESGWEESWYHFIFNGQCRHSNFLVFQLMLGLHLFNQGKPKIILCFPNLVTSSQVVFVCPLWLTPDQQKREDFTLYHRLWWSPADWNVSDWAVAGPKFCKFRQNPVDSNRTDSYGVQQSKIHTLNP